ncbi:MAG: hypothetical protein HY579_10985 [Nitrospinae bacterium]|nr:hypothetical protein [Nitrospinota bacterium]
MELTPTVALVLFLAFLAMSFFMGMMIHSAFVYEDKNNLKKDSKKAWVLCMSAGLGIMFWIFLYGYYANFHHK